MKKYQSPEIHFEIIAPEEAMLLSYSENGKANDFDLGSYLEMESITPKSRALGFSDFE